MTGAAALTPLELAGITSCRAHGAPLVGARCFNRSTKWDRSRETHRFIGRKSWCSHVLDDCAAADCWLVALGLMPSLCPRSLSCMDHVPRTSAFLLRCLRTRTGIREKCVCVCVARKRCVARRRCVTLVSHAHACFGSVTGSHACTRMLLRGVGFSVVATVEMYERRHADT